MYVTKKYKLVNLDGRERHDTSPTVSWILIRGTFATMTLRGV